MKQLHEFLNHKNVEVVRETVWMLSNILAGTEKQIKAVFDAGLMPKIIALLESNDKNVAEVSKKLKAVKIDKKEYLLKFLKLKFFHTLQFLKTSFFRKLFGLLQMFHFVVPPNKSIF